MTVDDCVHLYTKEDFEKLHTKQLLKLRYTIDGNIEYDCVNCKDYAQCMSRHNSNLSQLYAVLNTREHVPNKQESKRLRKLRKQQGN